MTLFPGLPQTPHLADVYKAFPGALSSLLEHHDAVLRAPSPLSIGEREVIAAYVSGLNACAFCFGAHKLMARAFGVNEAVFDALVEDIDTAPIDEKLKPLLHYVKKLTVLPARLGPGDAQAVYEAGWSEQALFDAIQVCALFNYMNRIIEGAGVSFDYADAPSSEDDLKARRSRDYVDWGREIGALDASE